jgi:hypothetical protein
LLLGGIGVAVVIAIVVIVIIATSGSGGGTGPTTQTSTSSSTTGSSTSAGAQSAVPAVPATCEQSPIDGYGMTPCMAALAGPVKGSLSLGCAAVPADKVQDLLHSIVPVAVSGCTGLMSGDLNVVYIQLDTEDHAVQAFDAMASDFKATPEDWSQGGASGQYLTWTDSAGQPELIASYSQVPVIVAVTVVDGKSATADEMKSYWQSTLLPPA